MNQSIVKSCLTESDMQRLGAELASTIRVGSLLTLSGELGTGKSVFARSVLQALGYSGHVKSPTYTLIETYDVPDNSRNIKRIAHLDLYRLSNAEELYYIGIEEVLNLYDLIMIEWPENGAGVLPAADIQARIDYVPEGGRCVHLNFGVGEL